MAFKINISSNEGKTWKLEADAQGLNGKSLGDKVQGSEISPDLTGYELEIMGGSDSSGFPMYSKIEGIGLKGVILTKGWGMHKRPRREGKKKRSTPRGLRKRKTVRAKTISNAVVQINLKVLKIGNKHLKDIFPDQNQQKELKQKTPKEAVEIPAQ